jgi:nucleoid DNA-binding protein
MVNKAELIDVLTEKLGTDRRHATAAVENFVDTVVRAVQKGESVTITGFGVFEQRRRAARVARNPRTGETVKVKPTSVPAFRPGAQFKAVVSGAQRLPSEGPAVKRGVVASGSCQEGGCQEGSGQEGRHQEGAGQEGNQGRKDGGQASHQSREEGSGQEGSDEAGSGQEGCRQGSGQEGRNPSRPPVGAHHFKR